MIKPAAVLMLALSCAACGDGSDADGFAAPDAGELVQGAADAGAAPVPVPVLPPAADASSPAVPVPAAPDAGVADGGAPRVIELRAAGSCDMPGAITGTLFAQRCVSPAELAASGCVLAIETSGGARRLTATVAQIEAARFSIIATSKAAITTYVCTGAPLAGVGFICGNGLFGECVGQTCTGPTYLLSPVPTHHLICG